MAKRKLILTLDSKTREITDQKGRVFSADTAEVFWNDGKVDDCNSSFQRWANMGFDFDALDAFYETSYLA